MYIIHADGDEELVKKFTKLITRYVKFNSDGKPITVCTNESFLGLSSNRLDIIQWGFNTSRRQLVFLTEKRLK